MQGSRVGVTGRVVTVGDDSPATFINNIFVRSAGGWGTPAAEAPIAASPGANLTLKGNVFQGYGTDIVSGVPDGRRKELLPGNIVVPPVRNR